MKTLAKSALGVAVSAAVAAASVQASEAVTVDPSLTFTYKNYYWKETAKDDNGYDRNEWAHGLVADFDSGYVNDLVGAVVTAGYAGPLKIKEGFNYSASNVAGSYIDDDLDGDNDTLVDSHSISGFQQAYLKAKHTFSGVDLAGTVGVKKRSTETYADSGSRILGASSTGYDLSVSFEGASLYFTEITGFSGRNDSSFSNDLSDGYGNKVENVRIFGSNYSYEDLDLAAEYGESKELIQQLFLKAAYSFELDGVSSIDLDARYGKSEANGDLASSNEPEIGADYEAQYYNLNATYSYGNAYVGVGYNKTKDGDYIDRYVDGNNDSFNSSLAQWEDYSLAGEKAYLVNGGYNFSDQGLEGLSWDVWFAKGTDAKEINNFKRREYGSYISYAFDGSLEGLSLAWLYVNYRADGSVDDSNDEFRLGTLYDEDVNRLYLTYSVAAF
ncbi:OprD family outer membrane porin [Endozoicomonas sp. SCSIO W0465]|uniref:OprD family outer membrane porin n=1 Tax=Endozoicomonas sp. SCSIO W0465 TaxID=2918516 RepID=UPI00207564EF|nr:OprD family outer membrane porin [Endozoicomonas sp. SCSIO W0465]USE34495.1 OprD family porin [Endozoicomonas sp. SCSIO W0465]